MAYRGKIEAFVDCNSFYSRFAVLHLRKHAAALREHGIDYEIHPVFIAGINKGSGNKPPWTLPAKANYGKYDSERAVKYFGVGKMQAPDGFPLNTLLPLRSMCYIKAVCVRDVYEQAFGDLWTAMFEDNVDVSKPELLARVLSKHFDDHQIKGILQAAASPLWKDALSNNTQRALDLGAFGAPWFWVRNEQGKEEPFFGSDRFHYMWSYLGIPHRDFEVLSKTDAKL